MRDIPRETRAKRISIMAAAPGALLTPVSDTDVRITIDEDNALIGHVLARVRMACGIIGCGFTITTTREPSGIVLDVATYSPLEGD